MNEIVDYSNLNVGSAARRERWPMTATGLIGKSNIVLDQPAAVIYRQAVNQPQSADYSLLTPARQMEWELIESKYPEAVQTYSNYTIMIVRYLSVPETAAPIWLQQRMETLRRMPPPTLQEVRTQLKASAEVRRKLDDRQIDL